MNYNTPEKKVKLETARRRERRLLWHANVFIKEALAEDPSTQVYFEWPHPCFGWRQIPMENLAQHLEEAEIPWLPCRIDGCNYGMKDRAGVQFIQKKWLLRTTDEQFHRAFRAKVCPGNHGVHGHIEGSETAESAYYPWRMVQAIVRHWRDQDVPGRHLRLLALREDQPWLADDEEHKTAETAQIRDDFLEDYEVTEGDLEGLTSSSGDQCVSAGDLEGLTSSSGDQCVSAGGTSLSPLVSMVSQYTIQGDFSYDALESILMFASKHINGLTPSHTRWQAGRKNAFVLGAYSHGGFGGISNKTKQLEVLVRYLNAFLRRRLPQGSRSSLMISFDSPALPHRDFHNAKNSTNYLVGVGPYDNGGLWTAGYSSRQPMKRRKTPDGRLRDGFVQPTRHQIVCFDPDVWHASEKWSGFRIVLSAYTTRMTPHLQPEELRQLRQLGFPLPDSSRLLAFPAEGSSEPADAPHELPPGVTKLEFEKWEAQVSKFHKAAGHPTNRNLGRIIQEAGHPQWKVDVALNHVCPACQSLKQGGTSSGQVPPAATHPQYSAWEAVGADVGEWVVPESRTKVKFVVFVDLATKLRVLKPLQTYNLLEMKAESTMDIVTAFCEGWLACFPKPKVLLLDSAKSLSSEAMHGFASSINLMVHLVAEKEHWAHGAIEAVVQDIKHTASAIHLEARHQDPRATLYLATSALNSTEYTAGFSSLQWAFGKQFSLNDEDLRTIHDLEPDVEFARLVTARQHAEAVAQRTRAKRVLTKLGNTTVRQPLRNYNPLDLVKIWRKVWPKSQHVGPRGGFRKSGRPMWIGPGRVVFSEVLPHQAQGDPRRHVVWVLVGTQLFRCSVHSVRPVTETERFQFESVDGDQPSQWKSLEDILPRKEYHDLVDYEPAEDEVEVPDLPREPDSSTIARPPTRRVRAKTTPTVVFEEDAEEPTENGPAAPSASSTTKHTVEVNDYEAPQLKRRKGDEVGELNWVEALQAEARLEEQRLDIFTAMDETEEFLKIEFDIGGELSNRQRKNPERNPVAYMVKKMRDSEVVLTRLPEHERKLFNRAKTKEVDSFITNEAVRKCKDNAEVRHAYSTGRIVKARWVLTWKAVPPEDREEARRDQRENPKTLHGRDGAVKAKARIVLLGFQHPNLLDPSFKTASPVQSSLGRHLLYSMAAQNQWDLEGLDLATAFLQTQPTEADQELWTTGVQELRDALGITEPGIMRILRNIYGSTTAPRGLWLSLNKRLTELGGQPVLGERCLWIWLSKTVMDGDHPKVIGAMGGHVDDFHRIGDNSSEWLDIKKQIDTSYKWGMAKTDSYRHAGTDVSTVVDENNNKMIVVDQTYYTESIADVEISPERIRQDEIMTAKEKEACRTALGVLSWPSIQSQPLLCARCNLLLTELSTDGSMRVAREIQALIGEVRQAPTKLTFRKFPSATHWTQLW